MSRTLSRSWATALGVAALLAASDAAAAPSPVRVVVVPVRDGAGLDADRVVALEAVIRGAALDADVEALPIILPAGQECDASCLGRLAGPAEAGFTLATEIVAAAPGYTMRMTLLRRGDERPYLQIERPAEGPAALVPVTAEAARRLFAASRGDLRSFGPASRADGAAGSRAARSTRSPALAVTLEILFPGVGLIYAEDYGSLSIEYGGILVGILLLVSGQQDGGGVGLSTTQIVGVSVLIGSRIFGIVQAPSAAERVNERAAGLDLRRPERLTLSEPTIGLSSPRAPTLQLARLTF